MKTSQLKKKGKKNAKKEFKRLHLLRNLLAGYCVATWVSSVTFLSLVLRHLVNITSAIPKKN